MVLIFLKPLPLDLQMWGGVIVWNPPSCLGHVENHLPVSQKISADVSIYIMWILLHNFPIYSPPSPFTTEKRKKEKLHC